MTTLKTTVTEDIYQQADAKARAEGTTISAVLRAGLMAWLDSEQSEVSGPSDTPADVVLHPTVAQWQQVVQYVRDNPAAWAGYLGPRDTSTAEARAAVYRWFLETQDRT